MSQTIDHRVVEMRFDNKQFEAGAKQTMGTLGKLKEALKLPETGKALEGIGKATKDIKLDGLVAGVEALERRFSTLGIVGMRVIENITDGLMNKVRSAVSFVTDAIVSGGIKRAMNIENAHFQLQALLKDETKVQAVMADAMESVDGTAYAYDEAAKAASQFAASGIQAGEEMLGALKGITGVAAMTNSSFEDISRIFTTVAGNGRLMGDQLLQLSSRGLNAASTLADYFREVRGQAGMTEATIREMVSKGQISFKDFSDAMTWAFGDSAKRANETFTGAMSNMKSALARIGAGFISPLVEQNGELVQLFNALRIKINDVKSALVFDEQRSAIAGLAENSNLFFDNMTKIVKDGSVGFDEVTTAILGASKSEKDLTYYNEKLSESFNKVKENGSASVQTFIDFNRNGINASKSVREYINGVLDGTINVSDATKKAINEISGGTKIASGQILKMAEEGKISYDIFTEAIVNTSGIVEKESKFTSDTIKNMMLAVKETGSVTAETLVEFNNNGMNAAVALREYMNGVLNGSIRASYATRQAIEEITEGMSVGAGDITKFAEEGKIGFDIFQSAMEEAYGTEKTLSKQFTDSFQDMVKNIVTAINEADMTKAMEVFYYGIEASKNAAKGLLSVLGPVGKAFSDVFLNFNSDDVISFSKAVEELTAKMKLSESGSKNLHDAFKGIFDVVDLLVDGFISLLSAIIPIEKPAKSLSGNLLELAGNAGRTLSQFAEWARKSQTISKAYNFISIGVEKASGWLDKFINTAGRFTKSVKDFPFVQEIIKAVSGAIDNLGGITEKFENRFTPFNSALGLLLGVIKKSGPVVVTIAKEIGNAFSFLLNSISKTLGTGDFNSIYDLFNVAVLSGIGIQLSKFIENVNKTVTSAGGFLGSIKKTVSAVTKVFDELQTTLKAETLKKIAVSLALIAGSIFVLSMVDSEKLAGALAAVTVLLGELTGIFVLLNKLEKNKKSAIRSLGALISMAISILILSSALKKISDIDSEKLLGSLGAITALLTEMTAIAIALSKYGGKIKTGVTGIIAFSVAIYILTSSVKKLGELDISVLKKGLTSVAALLAELSAFMVGAKFGKFKTSQAIGIVILSASLLILQKAVDGFGSMNTEKLLTGIIAVGAVLTEIAAFSLAAGESKHILSTSVSLVIIAKALEMLEKPITTFGNMNIAQIGKGLLAMGGALAEITLAMRLLPKNTLSIGVGLIIVANALSIITDAVLKMRTMSWEEIGKGMSALSGSMIILAVAMNAMKGTLGASAAMLIMAESLAIFVPVLKSLASMSWTEIAKGLVALAAGFAVVGVAGALLSPVIPAMLGLAGAMTLLGIAAAAVGVGVLALSVGLATLAASGVAGAAALVEVAKILIVGFLNAISDSAVAIARVIKTLVLTTCDVLLACVPTIVKTVLILVKEILTALADNAPEIVSQLLKLIIGIVDALAADLPTVIQSIVNLFMKFFDGLIQALNGIDTSTLLEGIIGIGLISAIMLALAAMAGLAPSAMVGVLAMGAVIAELAIVLAAIGALAQIPGLNWLVGKGGDLLQGVGTAIGKFIGGIVGGTLSGISAQLPKVGSDLSKFMVNLQPFMMGTKLFGDDILKGVGILTACILALTVGELVSGIANLFGLSLVSVGLELSAFMIALMPFIAQAKNLDEESMKACGYLADMIIKLTAADLLAGIGNFLGIGGNLKDFAEELEAFGPSIKKFAEDVKDVKPEAVQGAAAAAEIMAEVASKLQGHGGIIQQIVGEKSLADFAEELEAFGPSIKKFAEDVKDVKPEAVQGAAAAAEIMAEVANKLPEGESLKSKIFGSSISLSEFGDELTSFAKSIAPFCDDVKDIDPSSVTATQTITTIMTDLANNLPSSESLWNKIFGGGQVTLSAFGEELVAFGYSMSDFSDSLSGLNVEQINAAISTFRDLVGLATSVQDTSAEGLVNFSNQLSQIGIDSVDKFTQAFIDSTDKTSSAVNKMLDYIIKAIISKYPMLQKQGTTSMTNFLNGIKLKYPETIIVGSNIVLKVIEGVKKKFQDLVAVGTQSANKYLEGLEKQFSTAESIGTNLSGAIVKGLKDSSGSFYDAGTNAADGYVKGLKSKMSEVEKVSKSMGEASYKSAAKALDEHSPSKKMGQVANYAGLGFINSLMLYVSKAAMVGKEIGDATYNGISLVMDDLSLTDPVIRPVVDLTNVKESFGEIEAMFNDAIQSANNLALSTNMQNYKSNNTDQSILQDYISRMNKDNNDAFIRLRDAIEDMKQRGVNVSVYLEGDAKGVFKLVRTENDNFIATARYNPLAKTTVTKG